MTWDFPFVQDAAEPLCQDEPHVPIDERSAMEPGGAMSGEIPCFDLGVEDLERALRPAQGGMA